MGGIQKAPNFGQKEEKKKNPEKECLQEDLFIIQRTYLLTIKALDQIQHSDNPHPHYSLMPFQQRFQKGLLHSLI